MEGVTNTGAPAMDRNIHMDSADYGGGYNTPTSQASEYNSGSVAEGAGHTNNNEELGIPVEDLSHVNKEQIIDVEHHHQYVLHQQSKVVRWYFTPLAQCILLGFVCFLCPGMFNALTGKST